MPLPDPTISVTDERGYKYDETSDAWKQMCAALPCFAGMHWPDYDTKVIEDTINGQPVVIQLWKGLCPQFLGLSNFPGGYGAEVGIYRRVPGRQLPADLSWCPAPIRDLMKLLDTVDPNGLWWPAPELSTTISFEMINPDTTQLFFYAPDETTYWRNRWMEPSSYADCKRDQAQQMPSSPTGFRLDFVINGKTYSW